MRAVVVVVAGLLVLLGVGIPSLAQDQRQYEAGVWELAWSPDGLLLAGAGLDGYVYVMDVDGKIAEAFAGHSASVYTVAWSPDGRFLASGGLLDRFVRIWNLTTRKLHRQIYPVRYQSGVVLDPGVWQIVWSSDGAYMMATSFDTFQFWDSNLWSPLEPSRRGSIYDAEWSPDGLLLAVTDIYYFSFFNGQTLISDDLDADVIEIPGENPEKLDWSSDGTLWATNDRLDIRVSIWDTATRTRIATFTDASSRFIDIAFIAEDHIAAITEEGTLYVIDAAGDVLATYETGVSDVTTLAWNSQEELFAVAGMETILSADGNSGLALVALDDVMSAAPTP
jgi:WD40 repeat protein